MAALRWCARVAAWACVCAGVALGQPATDAAGQQPPRAAPAAQDAADLRELQGKPPAPELAKHSFSTPVDVVNPFSGMRTIAEWDAGGSAVIHRGFVRLTAEKQAQKGWLVNRNVFTEREWSLTMELRATGVSPFLFGDGARTRAPYATRPATTASHPHADRRPRGAGLAIWLVDEPDAMEGPVFGRQDYWKGLAIFFDTFQNIDHSHHHKHPYIYAVLNDGTMHYVPDADVSDPAKQALPGAKEGSGCSFDFRCAERIRRDSQKNAPRWTGAIRRRRYHEARTDVSVLNHTRVHVTYQNRILKLRLQQVPSLAPCRKDARLIRSGMAFHVMVPPSSRGRDMCCT